MTTKMPVHLEQLRIATPCSADWDDMSGDAQVRFCGRCEKNVYNLSAMTREAGETLLREKEGRACVRLYRRADGTVLTADCPVGVRRQRLRQRMWASLSGAAVSFGLALGLLGGRARGDLTLRGGGKKGTVTTTDPKTATTLQGGPMVTMQGGAMPTMHLMGKPAPPPPPQPKKPQPPAPVMGEPAPIMGDVAIDPRK